MYRPPTPRARSSGTMSFSQRQARAALRAPTPMSGPPSRGDENRGLSRDRPAANVAAISTGSSALPAWRTPDDRRGGALSASEEASASGPRPRPRRRAAVPRAAGRDQTPREPRPPAEARTARARARVRRASPTDAYCARARRGLSSLPAETRPSTGPRTSLAGEADRFPLPAPHGKASAYDHHVARRSLEPKGLVQVPARQRIPRTSCTALSPHHSRGDVGIERRSQAVPSQTSTLAVSVQRPRAVGSCSLDLRDMRRASARSPLVATEDDSTPSGARPATISRPPATDHLAATTGRRPRTDDVVAGAKSPPPPTEGDVAHKRGRQPRSCRGESPSRDPAMISPEVDEDPRRCGRVVDSSPFRPSGHKKRRARQ